MTPQHPNWSSLTDVNGYPVPAFQRPPAPDVSVQNIALGPAELNQSAGKLNSRYWLVSQEAGQVIIRGSIL